MSVIATVGVWGLAAVIITVSVWAAVSDAKTKTIPNVACAAIAVAGLLFQVVRQLTSAVPTLIKPVYCVLFAVVVLGVLYGIEALLRRRGKAGLGFGDVKFLAAWALVLGDLMLVPWMVASLVAAVFAINRKEKTFPYAPWLTACFVVTLILACILR